jgi:hypothetical protein
LKFRLVQQKILSDKNDLDNNIIYKLSITNNLSKDIQYFNGAAKLKNIGKIKRSIRLKFESDLPYSIPNNNLPWNIVRAKKYKIYNYLNNAEPKEYRKAYNQLYGWYINSFKFYRLRRFLSKTLSTRGQNSPRTVIDLWEFVQLGSPGKVNYKIDKLYNKSKKYINLVDPNFNPSYTVIGEFLDKLYGELDIETIKKIKITNKLAIKIAIITLLKFHNMFKIDDKKEINIFDKCLVTFLNTRIGYQDEHRKFYYTKIDYFKNDISYKQSRDLLIFLIHFKQQNFGLLLKNYPEIALELI